MKAPRDLGLFVPCSEAQNVIISGARKIANFANFAVITIGQHFQIQLKKL